MIIYKTDDSIFNSTALFIVNPVNAKGVSGKGLALEFKKRHPKNFTQYHLFCTSSSPKGGDLLFYYPEQKDRLLGDRGIVNFCTKEDWKKPSKLEWIEKGIAKLIEQLIGLYPNNQYPSPLLAFPMLGCGEGGLSNKDVLEVFKKVLLDVDFDVEVYI
jgi:hypothetical protein